MTSGPLWLGVAALAAASAMHAPAWAQPPTAEQRAKELFKQSAEEYRSGHFADALSLLEQAHALDPKPVLLYNMARAHEGLGDAAKALASYRAYLEADPNAKDRGAIEQRIATLQRQLDEREALRRERERPAAVTAAPSPARPADEPRGASAWPWLLAGGGAAVAGAGAVFAVVGHGRHDDAEIEPSPSRAASLQSDAERFVTVANVMVIAGAAIALGGVVWGFADLGRPTSPRKTGTASWMLRPFDSSLVGRF